MVKPNNPNHFLLAFLLLIAPSSLLAKSITLYTDDDWFPYVYSENGESTGIQVDIVKAALKTTNYSARFIPCPWKRCLLGLKNGDIDAVVSASYTKERASYTHYPDSADSPHNSKWRLGEVDYVLVSLATTPYNFSGDFSTIPQPVGVAFGASIGEYLNELKVKTTEQVRNINNVRMLLAKRIDSVAMNSQLAADLNSQGEFAGLLKIHQHPLRSKPYFLVFSKSGTLSNKDRDAIWNAIEQVRNDKKLLRKIFKKYRSLHSKD